MRSAAATFGDDIGAASPPSRRPARKPARKPRGGAARGGKPGGFFRLDRVARVAAVAMAATIGAGILVNALMMQKGRHPAPLFAKAEAPPAPAPVAPEAAPTVPAPEAVAAPPPAAAKPKRAAPVAAPDDDPIGRLLKGAPAADKAEKADRSLVGVQKALAKLGFAVKADGTMGATTRKAIEAYEKGHKLPVKGEVSRRLVKALAADSGVRID